MRAKLKSDALLVQIWPDDRKFCVKAEVRKAVSHAKEDKIDCGLQISSWFLILE